MICYHFLFCEELNVGGKIVDCLPRKSAHDSAAHLISVPAKRTQAPPAATPGMSGWMQSCIQFGTGRLDPQQIAVGAGVAPPAVCVVRLFAKTQRDAESVAEPLPYPTKDTLDECRVLLTLNLARLENKVPVTGLERQFGAPHDLIRRHPVAMDIPVVSANAAVETVLGADVAALDETAQRDSPSHLTALHIIRGGKQFPGVGPFQEPNQILS